MEKLKATHELSAFQRAFALHRAITATALKSALSLGYDLNDVGEFVRVLDRHCFVKSMTSHGNHRQWQDVYHLRAGERLLYLKFTDAVLTEFVLLSFKER